MTHETEPAGHDDVEAALGRFRPKGPSADLRARALAAEPAPKPGGRWRRLAFAGLALGALAVVLMTVWSGQNDRRSRGAQRGAFPSGPSGLPTSRLALAPDERAAFTRVWMAEPRVNLGIPTDGATVLVVEFVDWLCAACEDMHRVARTIAADHEHRNPGRVKYVVADWPWDAACNASVTTTLHPGACAAAAAVRVARSRDKGNAMEDWLFANRARIAAGGATATDTVRIGAAEVLGTLEFNREFDAALVALRRDTAPGGAFAPTSTPTILVNGVKLNSALRPEFLDLAVQIELGGVRTFGPRGRTSSGMRRDGGGPRPMGDGSTSGFGGGRGR